MNYERLYILDSRLCDVFLPLGEAVSTAGNITATAMTNRANKEIAEATNKAQMEMLTQSQDFSHGEAELAHQRDLEKMRMEQQYNSPIEQVKRYQEAGINPAVAMSGQLGAASSGNVSASSGSPQAMTPNIPLLHSPQMISPDLSHVGQIYKAIAEGKKTSLETTQLQKQFEKMMQDWDLNIEAKRIENFLSSTFGPALRDSEVRKNLSAATQSFSAAYYYRESGNTQDSLRALNQALALMNNATANLRGKEAQLAQENINAFGTRLKQEISESQSRIASNYASATLSRQQSEEIKTLLPTREQMLQADAKLRNSQNEYTLQVLAESKERQRKFAQECALITEEIRGKKLTNDQLEILSNYYEETLAEELKSLKIHVKQQGRDYTNPFKYVGGLLGAPAAAAIKVAAK